MRRVLVLALFFAAAATLFAQAPPMPWVVLTPVAETDAVTPGSTIRLIVETKIHEQLHIQSNRPYEESSIPTTLTLDLPEGGTFTEVVFPKSSDMFIAGSKQPTAVFGGTLLIGAQVSLPKNLPVGTLEIPAHLRYQACNDVLCFQPKTADFSWTLRVVQPGTPIRRVQPDLFRQVAFGKGEKPKLPTEAPAVAKPPASAVATSDPIAAIQDFRVLAAPGGYMNTADFLQQIRDAESGVQRRGPFEGQGPLAILALVFLGGLALNLTPCVLPMIPINLAIIGAGSQSPRRGRGFLLGAAYGAAMAAVYGVLGLVVIMTAGTFGTINASPWFNAGIAALFVVLALAMFDVISLDFSRYSSRIRFGEESRGSFFLAFAMGAVAALLAGACVAPVVIQVVVFASDLYNSGSRLALALPFVLGLGMALPWPLAGAGMSALPKPGAWMVRVKQVMGVFILGTAVYYGYLAYEIFASRSVDPSSVTASVEEKLKEGWYSSLPEGLAAAKQNNTPVLIDFWATWCKNCLTMDKTTLADPAVIAALSGYTKIKVQAEDPEASPAKELLKYVGGVGLPTYAILRAK